MAPTADRGWGMPAGTATTGTSHSPARLTSDPPPDTTISDAPGLVGAGRGLQGLLGVARERQGEHQRSGTHEIGGS